MPLSIACPVCKSVLQIPDNLQGQAVLCGHCSKPIQVPAANTRPIPMPMRAHSNSSPAISNVGENIGHGGPTHFPNVSTSRELRSGTPRNNMRPRPSNLIPVLSWVGVFTAVIALIVTVFIIGNRRREQRQLEATAKAARSQPAKISPTPPSPSNQFGNSNIPVAGTPSTPPPGTNPPFPAPAPPTFKPLPKPQSALPVVPAQPVVPREPSAEELLAKLPSHLKLPSLIATALENVLPLGGVAPTGLQLLIPNANIPKEAAFLLEERTKLSEWSVLYCPNIESKPPVQTEIAKLSIKEGGMWFQWTEPFADTAIREQLSNGHLAIKAGKNEKKLALRVPRQAPKIVLDLSKPTDATTLEIGALPRHSAIAIQLLELEGFTRGAHWKNETAVLGLGKKATVEFKDVEGARIELTFAKRADDTLVITVKPIFIEQTQPTEMTTKRLIALEASLPNTIAEAVRDLQVANSQLSSLQSELQSLSSRQPSSLAEVNAMNVESGNLQSKIRARNTRISQLQRRIQKLNMQQTNLPEARKFLGELHQKASIKYNIVAAGTTENDPLLLVRGIENSATPVQP